MNSTIYKTKTIISSEQADETLDGRMNPTLKWIKMTTPLYEKLKTIGLVQKQIHLDILHNHEKLQIRSQPEHRYKDL